MAVDENLIVVSRRLSKAATQITTPTFPCLCSFRSESREEFIHPVLKLLMDLRGENPFISGQDLSTVNAKLLGKKWRAIILDIPDVLLKTGAVVVFFAHAGLLGISVIAFVFFCW